MDQKKSEEKQKKNKSKNSIIIVLIVILMVGLGFAYFSGLFSKKERNIEDKEDVVEDKVVATVNGESIYRSELENQISLATSTEGISEQQFLEQIIKNKLFFQKAEEVGITANEESINSQYNQIADQFETEEEFEQILTINNLTKEELRDRIAEQIVFDNYLDEIQKQEEVTVTDEELESFYEVSKEEIIDSETGEVIPFEQVKTEIEQIILQQKLTSILNDIVNELFEEADINIFL